MKRYKSSTHGFTLVELLVVIGIIALLISVLLPALNKARSSAKTLACSSNLRQIALAMHMYAQANEGWLPAGSSSPSGSDYNWPLAFAPYAGGQNNATGKGVVKWPKVYRCPNAAFPDLGNFHYTCNAIVMPDVGRAHGSGYGGMAKSYLRPYRLDRVRPAAKIMVFFDGGQVSGASMNYSPYSSAWGMNRGFSNQDAIYWEEYFKGAALDKRLGYKFDQNTDWGSTYNAELRYRELGNRAINVAFADGHVETHKLMGRASDELVTTLVQSNMRPRGMNLRRSYPPTTTKW